MKQIQQITILGVGLMGGSLGLSLKENGFKGKRVGLGRRIETLEVALQCQAVDEITTDFSLALTDTDLVVICTPIDKIPSMVELITAHADSLRPLILTDVGSVKAKPIQAVEKILETFPQFRFVGGHPMAGSEKTGVLSAQADLYQSAKCLLTPTATTSETAVATVTELWELVGAKVHILTPDQHDQLLAAASHLPHLIASVLTETVGRVSVDGEAAIKFSATGFRDTTRIAAGSPDLWNSIFLQNRTYLIPLISDLIGQLRQFQTDLQNNDEDQIRDCLTSAKQIRQALES